LRSSWFAGDVGWGCAEAEAAVEASVAVARKAAVMIPMQRVGFFIVIPFLEISG
jgi:hypothetical protein